MNKDEAPDIESLVFEAENIKADCAGWCLENVEKGTSLCSCGMPRKVKATGRAPPPSDRLLFSATAYKKQSSCWQGFLSIFTPHTQIVCNLNANKNILFSTGFAFPFTYIPPPCVSNPISGIQSINPSIQTSTVCLRLRRAAARDQCASCRRILRWQINNATINFI